MGNIAGYRLGEPLVAGPRATLSRARRAHDDAPVLIHRLNRAYPDPQLRATFLRSHQVMERLAREGVRGAPTPLDWIDDGEVVASVFADIDAAPLGEALGALPIDAALRVGRGLAEVLGAVHGAGLVHQGVQPEHALFDRASGRCWLFDFGASTALGSVSATRGATAGAVAYLAPEQTGRMNRPVDYRADWYALGLTLYALLAGHPPFVGDDVLELVHAHIALEPVPLHTLERHIPRAVSALVDRLLAKAAEDRYQSAAGLLADLDALIAQPDRDDLTLGRSDVSERFTIPNRLYGREAESERLLASFARATGGRAELLFVSGYAGIGKSALIHEVQKPIVQSRGYFIEGKFDQLERNVPYASLIQAFDDLVQQLLTEPAARIERWRDLIGASLGGVVGVAASVLPRLALIVGEQAAPPELSGEAAQNRLNRTFLELVKVFARADHPLVLFLDDLQWADRPTLDLLRILVTDDEIGHLMVIGCYRDNEVDANHPLRLTLDTIAEQRAAVGMTPVEDLHLGGLEPETLTHLVADCVRAEPAEARPLADLIHEKTLGNPFFVGQFLRALHQAELLRFEGGRWRYDLGEIEAQQMTDNVVELMTGKIERLPAGTRARLCLAAALGNAFSLRALAAVAEAAPSDVADDLWPALVQGYLVPLDDTYRLVVDADAAATLDPRYRFLHDRVQQAAYSLIDPAERVATHLRIGRALLADEAQLEAQLFDVVDQLAHGVDRITDPDDRVRLAAVFARAGDKARLASAHEPAIEYYRCAEALLGDARWDAHYALGQPVVLHRSSCEYLAGNFDAAEALFDQLVARSRTDLEKARVYRLKLSLYQSRGLFFETVDIAYRGLAHLGVNLPRDPSQATFLRQLARFKWRARGLSEADLKALPTCTDPRVVTALDLMNDFSGPAFFVDINIYLCVVLEMCSLSVAYGNAAESAYCWTLYGMMCGPIMGNVPLGMALGRVGEHVDAQHAKAALIPKVALSLGGLVYQWGQHPRRSIPYFERGFQAALESGDPTHAGYCANFMVCMFSVLGEPLDVIEATTSRFWDFARKNRIEVQSEIQVVERQMARCLRGLTHGAESWDDDAFDEAEWLARAREFQSRQPLHNYLIEKQATLYLMGRPAAALVCGDEAATMLDVSLGIPIFSNFHLFYGLVNAALVGDPAHPKARRALRKMLRQHTKWARHNPDGFEHKRLLLAAELARVQGRAAEAEVLYEQAAAQAGAQGFVHHQAIANELGARHLFTRGLDRLAGMLLREARYAYQRWGADAVVARLDAEFPEVRRLDLGAAAPEVPAAPSLSGADALDLDTILRATRAVSGEIVLGRLLETLMLLLLENAGARRALLVLDKRGGLVVEAEQVAGLAPQVLLEQPLSERDDLAHGVVNFVMRTGEAVVLDDASAPGVFAKDPWLAAQRTRSVLCAAIAHGGTIMGALYLENELTTGAFTPDRLELMRVLAAQLAISIENADHYRRAEQMATAFARFVPREFLTHMGHEDIVDVALGDAVQREMTVLFSDIRAFTAMSERMSPSENMAFLNRYLQRVGPVMREHQGFIDKYIGDAVMALFPDSADDAVRAAIAMHRQVDHFNADLRREGRAPLAIGVGLHHGSLMLGTIGEAERMDSTVIADSVNTASRLEGLTKAYGAPILISGPTLARCRDPDTFRHRYLGEVLPRGRAKTIALHEIYEPLPGPMADRRDQTREWMEGAVRARIAGDVAAARKGFQAVLDIDSDDLAARCFLGELDG